jgi:transketolase
MYMAESTNIATLQAMATRIRQHDLEMVYRARLGHIGGEFSAIDILATLYGSVLRFDPTQPEWPERDRFILSKGHAAAALYATLAEVGFLPLAELSSFMQPFSRLNGHPNRTKVPGVETNTGPLGHGLPVAVGCAIGARLAKTNWRTFVITGDGELQEGSNWEAAMAAAHYELDNLTVIIDRNRLQQGDQTERTMRLDPLADKWRAFGWNIAEVDGHDHGALLDVFAQLPFASKQPNCIIAHTHKGQGVSYMQDNVAWHHRVPNSEEYARALNELTTTEVQL